MRRAGLGPTQGTATRPLPAGLQGGCGGQPKFVSTHLCFIPAWWGGPCTPGLDPHPAQHDNPRKNVSRRQELLGTGETFQGHSCEKSFSSVLPKDWRPPLPPTDRLARKGQSAQSGHGWEGGGHHGGREWSRGHEGQGRQPLTRASSCLQKITVPFPLAMK